MNYPGHKNLHNSSRNVIGIFFGAQKSYKLKNFFLLNFSMIFNIEKPGLFGYQNFPQNPGFFGIREILGDIFLEMPVYYIKLSGNIFRY